MEPIPYSSLTKGMLLVAAPNMEGVYFRGAVLICEHARSGSFGLFINKMLDVDLPEEIINMKNLSNPNVAIRAGGPIQPGQMMLLHSSDKMAEQTLKVCDGVFLGGDIQFLQEAISDPSGPSIRLCFGYIGWGPSQLEREILAGTWLVHPGSAKYIFDTPAEKIWQTVLRDMGGKYATLSMIPEDLSLN
ncbi:MAG: YqgE/AlgH family protein [Chlamydiae bacterium]|nr:YqgE/AlgH family protein [Chlamydiota bacterium]